MIVIRKKQIFIKFLLLALVIIFSCTGITYAWWTDGLELTGKVEMGSIDPQLVSINVDTIATNSYDELFIDLEYIPNVTSTLTYDGAHFDITGARPGFIYEINYVIENKGTIPIILKSSHYIPYNPGLLVDYEPKEPTRIEAGSKGEGKIRVTVRDVIDEANMEFNIPLTFVQAVGIKEVDV
ncbi:MAG: hypothetical protein GX790_03395 [Syntrophomonadaceae bacterium]|nr:hypothetical protein [Syntrophomonadaceae bacterium]